MKFPSDIWIVESWIVKTGLGLWLWLGLGLVGSYDCPVYDCPDFDCAIKTCNQGTAASTFWPKSIVVKQLHGSTCHLVWTMEVHVRVIPDHTVLDGNPAPPQGAQQPPKFRLVSIVAKWLDGSKCHLARR